MRRTLGLQCSERQLWCELLPFTALTERSERSLLAPLVSYSSGVEQRPVHSKHSPWAVVSSAGMSLDKDMLGEAFHTHVTVTESATLIDDVDDIEESG